MLTRDKNPRSDSAKFRTTSAFTKQEAQMS